MELKDELKVGIEWPYYAEDEDMPESNPQYYLVHYLVSVLLYMFRLQGWHVGAHMVIRQPGYSAVTPDLMLCKVKLNKTQWRRLRSWNMDEPNRPAPAVVLEIGSDATWEKDLGEKVERYQQLGAKEYFTFDPNDPAVWRRVDGWLKGWRYNGTQIIALQPDAQGRLWSEELQCYLVIEDETELRLYNRQGELCLTGEQARQKAQELAEQRQKLAEQRQKLAEQQAETARQEKEQMAIKLERLQALLDQQGLDKNSNE